MGEEVGGVKRVGRLCIDSHDSVCRASVSILIREEIKWSSLVCVIRPTAASAGFETSLFQCLSSKRNYELCLPLCQGSEFYVFRM